MKTVLAALLVPLALGVVAAAAQTVATRTGKVKGSTAGDISTFLGIPYTGHDAEVAALMHRYWVNFAKTGSPEGDGVPAWPRATADTTTVQMIGTEKTEHVEDPRTGALDFRERLAAGK